MKPNLKCVVVFVVVAARRDENSKRQSLTVAYGVVLRNRSFKSDEKGKESTGYGDKWIFELYLCVSVNVLINKS